MFADTGGGSVYRHPSQLYEALLEGVVRFIILYVLSRKRPPRPQGTFIGTFLVGYGVFRFLIEFVRLPDAQLGYLLGTNWLTMGQCLSVPLVVAGVIVIVVHVGRQSPGRASRLEFGCSRRFLAHLGDALTCESQTSASECRDALWMLSYTSMLI